MSTTRSRGWDHRSDAEVGPLYLCSHHAAATERLSDHHTAQLARACPWCATPQRSEPQWWNGVHVR